jgi:HEAT repeat protein
LTAGNADVRLAATETLGQIGPAAAAALPVLGRLRSDPDPRVRQAAITARGKIDPRSEATQRTEKDPSPSAGPCDPTG